MVAHIIYICMLLKLQGPNERATSNCNCMQTIQQADKQGMPHVSAIVTTHFSHKLQLDIGSASMQVTTHRQLLPLLESLKGHPLDF